MEELAAYGGLLLVAFAAATLFPAQSEAALLGMLASQAYAPVLLVIAASTGNILGAMVNWALGRAAGRYRHRRWFPLSEQRLLRAESHYRRWGYWSLLASWLPIVGDPLTLVAGLLREPFWRFALLVSLAKTGRYVALVLAVGPWLGG